MSIIRGDLDDFPAEEDEEEDEDFDEFEEEVELVEVSIIKMCVCVFERGYVVVEYALK